MSRFTASLYFSNKGGRGVGALLIRMYPVKTKEEPKAGADLSQITNPNPAHIMSFITKHDPMPGQFFIWDENTTQTRRTYKLIADGRRRVL